MLRGVMNHLTGRRLARQLHAGRVPTVMPATPAPRPPTTPCLPEVDHVLDCYLDCPRADPAACVDVVAAVASPCIVSRIATGYIGQDPAYAGSVTLAAGRDEPRPEGPAC
jgi:hypothetical protein